MSANTTITVEVDKSPDVKPCYVPGASEHGHASIDCNFEGVEVQFAGYLDDLEDFGLSLLAGIRDAKKQHAQHRAKIDAQVAAEASGVVVPQPTADEGGAGTLARPGSPDLAVVPT